MVKIRGLYSYETIESDLEYPDDDDSLVVPDCSLSVKQILERFRRGTLNPDMVSSSGYYDDDDDDDDLDTPVLEVSDLADLSDARANVENIVSSIQSQNKE